MTDQTPPPDNIHVMHARVVKPGVAAAVNKPAPVPPRQPPSQPPAESDDLPPNCPVVPLGCQGRMYYYRDDMGQLRELAGRDHSRLEIVGLYGTKNHLLRIHWPRMNQNGDITGWRPEVAAEALTRAAAKRGLWSPADRVRGRGAWRDREGGLVVHCGDVIFAGETTHNPGLIEPFFYSAAPPSARPSLESARGGVDGPGAAVLGLLNTWRWRRGELGARLLLGWLAGAMIGGALGWRPVVWVTGGRGTGKSTLHTALIGLLGGACVATSDTTAAGLWQQLGYSTVPVLIDEAEPEQDDSRARQAVIKLARQAASGGLVLRGGADHNGTAFIARSAFLFSSILVPPLTGQDRSRLAILELDRLSGAAAPALQPAKLNQIGAQIFRRMVDGWARLPETLAAYRAALMRAGHDSRGADTFGTLLACADLALEDHAVDADSADALAEQLGAATIAETEEDGGDEQRLLSHLLSSSIPLDGTGARRVVADWIARAMDSEAEPGDRTSARGVLEQYGLKVVPGVPPMFAIANTHTNLARLLASTHWAGRSGSTAVWVQAARRLPGAQPSGKNLWFAGAVGKATLLPIGLVHASPGDLVSSLGEQS